MITNADITVYNACIDRDDGVSSYNATHIRGVNWQQELKVNVGDKGLNSANIINIFIPFVSDTENKTYVKPSEYERQTNKEKYFTFKNGDIVVKGVCEDELKNLSSFRQSHDDVVTIISVNTLDNGSSNMQHWEVGAK